MNRKNNSTDNIQPVTKEKLRSIMEAASALTALGEEDCRSPVLATPIEMKSTHSTPSMNEDSCKMQTGATRKQSSSFKRFIPEHKKPDAAPTFPEKLMSLMKYADTRGKDFCVAWLPDGKSFVIKNPDEFTRTVVPKYFKGTKFSSFTRKLYRWGFRQINRGIGPDDPIIFGNESFDRDAEHLISQMRSITAAASRKQDVPTSFYGSVSNAYDASRDRDETTSTCGNQQILLEHILQQKAANLMQQSTSFLTGLGGNNGLALSHALQPNIAMDCEPSAMKQNDFINHRLSTLGKFDSTNQFPSAWMQRHPHSLMSHFTLQGQGVPTIPNPQLTAEIVNAAIAALRYAN